MIFIWKTIFVLYSFLLLWMFMHLWKILWCKNIQNVQNNQSRVFLFICFFLFILFYYYFILFILLYLEWFGSEIQFVKRLNDILLKYLIKSLEYNFQFREWPGCFLKKKRYFCSSFGGSDNVSNRDKVSFLRFFSLSVWRSGLL